MYTWRTTIVDGIAPEDARLAVSKLIAVTPRQCIITEFIEMQCLRKTVEDITKLKITIVFSYSFSIYVQFRLLFTVLLLVANIYTIYIGIIGCIQVYKFFFQGSSYFWDQLVIFREAK
jgi:hypothetical protein